MRVARIGLPDFGLYLGFRVSGRLGFRVLGLAEQALLAAYVLLSC